jgi:hypothetical protein
MAQNVRAMLTYVSDAAAGRRELAAARLLDFSDFKPIAGGQAAAKPVGPVSVVAQEHPGLDALHVVFVGDGVSAR